MSRPFKPSAIPLRCTLCPKEPIFSDISHLLTHISSKGHLSHKFKLQIRGQTDPHARIELERYEIWYADNNLDELLAERLASKESKSTIKRMRTTSKAGPKPKPKEKISMLEEPIKLEYGLEGQGPATPSYRAQAPIMHMWNTQHITARSPFESEPPARWEKDGGYATPTMRRYVPNFTGNHSNEGDERTTTSATSPIKSSELQDDNGADNSKLKGIYWPGMALFDSATAEMKRMRNQKKDGSILVQMKNTSRDVKPDEFVYDVKGELQRVKDIYESSPLPSPTSSEKMPSAKKRRIRSKPSKPLQELSINIPMGSSRNGRNKRQTFQDKILDQGIRSLSHYNQPLQNPLGGFGKLNGHDEDREEMTLTANTNGNKSKLAVFRDEDERSPGRTESPLEERRFDFHNTFATDNLAPPPRLGLMNGSPLKLQKPRALQYGGNENIQRELPGRRPLGNENAYLPPHAFHTNHANNANPLFYHSYGYASYGFRDSPVFHDEYRPSPPSQNAYAGEFKPVLTNSNGFQNEYRPTQPSFNDYRPPQQSYQTEWKPIVMPSPFRNNDTLQSHHDFKPLVIPSPFRETASGVSGVGVGGGSQNDHNGYNSNPFSYNM